MSAESQNEKNKKDEQNDFEARQNLLGFFSLLWEIDKRINPHLYEKGNENNRDTNSAD